MTTTYPTLSILLATTVALTLTALVSPASADPNACRAEVEALCDGARSHEAMKACVEANFDQLSDTCQEAIAAMRNKRGRPGSGGPGAACRTEVEALCDGARSHEAMKACVEANFDQLSDTCQEAIAAMRNRRRR